MSAAVYALILSSPRLAKLVLPEGLWTSPYEILDYDATLTLHDPQGVRATFARRQRIRFLQNGVAAILDHAWGDGVPLTCYHNEAGSLADCLRDGARHHLVIGLKRPMARGETLGFGVRRTAMVGFTKDEEWLETTIDHPIKRLRCGIVFPQERPCLKAVLHYGRRWRRLPITTLGDGRTLARFALAEPQAHSPYTLCWRW